MKGGHNLDELTSITLSFFSRLIPDEIRVNVAMITHEESGDLVIDKEYTIDRDRIVYVLSQIADYLSASAHDVTIGQLIAMVSQIWEIIKPFIQQDKDNAGADSNIDED